MERERKSESRETTFPQDVTTRDGLRETVDAAGASRSAEPRRARNRRRTVTLKIRLRPFKTHTRSQTSAPHAASRTRVADRRSSCSTRFDPQAPVRLLGVGVAGLADRRGAQNEQGPAQRAPGRFSWIWSLSA